MIFPKQIILILMYSASIIGTVLSQQAPELAPGYLRVSMQLDEEIIPTEMFLEVNQGPLNLGYNDLSSELPDPHLAAFSKLMIALSSGQLEEAARYRQAAQFSQTTNEDMVNLFSQGFEGAWESLRVVRKYDLGSEVDLAWEVEVEGQVFRRLTRLAKNAVQGGDESFWLEEMEPLNMTALQNVLAEAEQSLLDGKTEFAEAADVQKKAHHEEVPGTSAKWHFDGLTTSFQAFEKSPAGMPDHPVARFFHEAMQTLKSGDSDAYAKLFTSFSQQRLRDWAAGLPEGGYAQYVEDMVTEGRQVVFILEADPVSLVFYETPDKRTVYQAVFEQAEGSYQLANFFVEGIFDSMVKDEDFFLNPILRPLFGDGPDPLPPVIPATPPGGNSPDDSAAQPGALPRAPRGTDASENEAQDSAHLSPEQGRGNNSLSKKQEPGSSPKLHPILLGLLALLALIGLLAVLKKFK